MRVPWGRPLPVFGRSDASQLLRFTTVGAGGFCVDGSVLLVAIHAFGANPVAARFVSFAVAVLFTYTLNRAWAFRHRVGFLRGLTAYLGVQGLGFACNLAIYSALLLVLPKPWNAPILCLLIASACAMALNFAGARLLVFRKR